MTKKIGRIIKWFESNGNKYINNILLPKVKPEKIKSNEKYALKTFFYYWAFERQGAPNGYKIAAIKSIASESRLPLDIKFKQYYKGKKNEINNPMLDKKLSQVSIVKAIDYIKKGKICSAFEMIDLNGLGHKIRSFFLRDIAYLFEIEKKRSIPFEEYLYLTPIDIWVRLTIKYLKISNLKIHNLKKSNYDMSSSEDFNAAIKLISICDKYNVSPLLTNMGIWFFCSRCVGDQGRLEELLEKPTIKKLDNEMNLLRDFIDLPF